MEGKDLFYQVTIKAGNAVEYDLSRDLDSFTIEEDAAKADLLTIQLSDPFKVFSHAFQEGMDVDVDLGRADDHSIIFRGRVYKVEASFPEDAVPTLGVKAMDNTMKMGLQKRNRPFADKTLNQIVTEVATPYFQRLDVTLNGDPRFTGNGIRQDEETDLGFLRRLAERYACEMYAEADDLGESFRFLARSVVMEADPAVTLYHGRCGVPNRLLAFDASGDVSDIQLPRVFAGINEADGIATEVTETTVEEVGDAEDDALQENLAEFGKRDPLQAERLAGLMAAASAVQEELRQELGTAVRETTPTFTTPEELQERRKNQFSTSQLGMRASGSTPGNKDMHAQQSLRILDASRFSGRWFLSQVKHVMNGNGYQTQFECQR